MCLKTQQPIFFKDSKSMTYSAMLSIFIEKYYVKKIDKIEEDVMESEYF